MECLDFYRFRSIAYNTTLAASPDIFEKAIAEGRNDFDRHCYRFLLMGEYEYYRFPIVFRQYDGKRLRDFLDTGWPPVYLVSDRVVSLLTENGITGWHNYPIQLFDKKANLIEGYSGFSILGKGGKYSKVWERGYNKETHESFIESRGLYDLGQWDGSDIFMVHGGIIITERVMKLMKANKVTAVEYEKLSDLVDYVSETRFAIHR